LKNLFRISVLLADDRESALFQAFSPGVYTVIVDGQSGTTGVGLVEAYHIQ
jgi:hypothetical protein